MRKVKLILYFLFFLLLFLIAPPAQAQEVKFVVAGHIYPGVIYPKLLQTFVNQVNQLRPDVLFLLGDNVVDGKEEDWQTLDQYLSQLKCPYHFVPGNHDLQGIGEPLESWMEKVGYLHKAVIINDYKFILLNTTPFKGKYRLDEEEIDFLKKELVDFQNYQQVFLMFHHELWMYPYINWEKEIYPIIKGKVTNVFAGNLGYHFFSRFPSDESITYFSNGFPKRRFYKEKPTFILAETEGKKLKTKVILVDLPGDDLFYQLNPKEKKNIIESIVDFYQGLGERLKQFGKKLLFSLLTLAFIAGFVGQKVYFYSRQIFKRKLKEK
jgi:calcineurin-like phosphoesterase family protein